MKYRLLPGKKHYVSGKRLAAGDEIELSKPQAEALADRFEPVAEGGAAKVEPPQVDAEVAPEPETTETAGPLGLDALHWAKAAAAVSGLRTDEELDRAAAEERSGKDRKGVFDAIAARRAELRSVER